MKTKKDNINGFCPHCKANLDGDLVIDYPLKQGKTMEEAIQYAWSYAGWAQHDLKNRWDRAISIYSRELDRTTHYRCPDCDKDFPRGKR